jgi:F420-dependent oxidoreductase-like protein
MRIGVFAAVGPVPVEQKIEQLKRAEESGFDTAWIPGGGSADETITIAAAAGRETSRIEIGTFVVPTYPRHPMVMAQQTLTASAMCSGRFTLGIGLSHRVVIEDSLGLDFSKPIRHMREYLSVLIPLLEGSAVEFKGEEYRVTGQLPAQGPERPPVVVAALGPMMLRLTGRLADGTAVWMGGPKYLEQAAIPTINAAAQKAGRPEPRIIAGYPVTLTGETEAAHRAAHAQFQGYGEIPSYRAILDVEGVGPADVLIAGDEAAIRAQMKRLEGIGVTDFNAYPMPVEGDDAAVGRTYEFLSAVAANGL